MSNFCKRSRAWALLGALSSVLLLAQSTAADWLVTTEGEQIETDGSWIIDDELVAYVDLAGELQTIHLSEVDLAASKEKAELESASEAEGGPKITVYMTSWCGYCRKARQLLDTLEAEYVAVDIEKDRDAAIEYRKKSGGSGGVPLIDFDGELVRGYNEQSIRRLARKVQQNET